MNFKKGAIVDSKLKKILAKHKSGEKGFEGYRDKNEYKFPLAKDKR